jgi:hypothetical protein
MNKCNENGYLSRMVCALPALVGHALVPMYVQKLDQYIPKDYGCWMILHASRALISLILFVLVEYKTPDPR